MGRGPLSLEGPKQSSPDPWGSAGPWTKETAPTWSLDLALPGMESWACLTCAGQDAGTGRHRDTQGARERLKRAPHTPDVQATLTLLDTS